MPWKNFIAMLAVCINYLILSNLHLIIFCLIDSSFSNETYMKNHVKAVHSKQKRFRCEVCGKTFARKAELQNHTMIHTRDRPFVCKVCNKTFNQKSNLKTHVRTTHNDEKQYKCTECEDQFKRRRLLTYHIYAKHRNEIPLKCPYCDKGFIYPQTFKKHVSDNCKSKPQAEYFLWVSIYLVFKCKFGGPKFNYFCTSWKQIFN